MSGVRGWVIAAAVFAATFLLWNVVAGAMSALLLLFTAILLSAGLQPFVDRLSKRMPFGAAVSVAFGAFIVIVVALGFLLVQPLGVELAKLIAALPGFAASLQDQLSALQRYIENDKIAHQIAGLLANGAGTVVGAIGPQLVGGSRLIVTSIGDGALILLLAIGWMLSAGELQRFVLSLIPERARHDWHETLTDIGARLSAYVRGVVLNGAIVGIVLGIALAILGVPYALLLAFIGAIFQAIPMVGAVISGPIILLVVLATSGLEKMLIVLVIFSVVQIVDQNIISPIIFGQRVQLSFLLVILATIVGGTLLGIPGAFLAVPAAAALQVIVVRIIAPAIRRANP
ncbi:MAG TPA: AI-2E family transporter [Candidatus Cybelea sp.]|jgi:predicted PurR-regulated permease PerM